jgi:hypothetical protein
MSFELGSPQFSFSYSRISLSDIAKKLSLDSKDPVAKAIRPSLADAASPPACGECVLLGYCSPPSSLHAGAHWPGRPRATCILPYSLSPPASEGGSTRADAWRVEGGTTAGGGVRWRGGMMSSTSGRDELDEGGVEELGAEDHD